jgi:hypothetical protein
MEEQFQYKTYRKCGLYKAYRNKSLYKTYRNEFGF